MSKYRWISLLCMSVLLIFSGCGKDSTENNTKPTDEIENYITEETTEKHTTVKNSDNILPKGLNTNITVEAGTREITLGSLFTPYTGQKANIKNPLTEQELKVAGAVYELSLEYESCEYVITVTVVDTTPPEIEGVRDISIFAGDYVSYKRNIVVTDNSDEEIEVEVDKSEVNTGVVGNYTVYYTATDSSGNVSHKTSNLYVNERPVINEEYVTPMADAVINSIITDEMSEWDKAYALFRWCRNNISYITSAGDRSSVWTGAYEGLHNRAGDCFTFYATYSVLLTRCGIENMQVSRVGGNTNHWWNLVNLGNGWYHCDSSPRSTGDSYICFMQTDEQVAEYTKNYTALHPDHPNYYTFDESLYPERGTTVVFGE